MSGYTRVNLNEIISELGEDEAKNILSGFYCPYNTDVEDFLKVKAIEFAKQGISQTHIVMASYKGDNVLVGYYTLSNKILNTSKKALSSKTKRRINRFAKYNNYVGGYAMPAPLIAQLGKNFQNDYNKLITGDELLKMACETVRAAQLLIGGKYVYLECEDKEPLVSFYSDNGFVNFGERQLDIDEEEQFEGKYLLQMIKYLK